MAEHRRGWASLGRPGPRARPTCGRRVGRAVCAIACTECRLRPCRAGISPVRSCAHSKAAPARELAPGRIVLRTERERGPIAGPCLCVSEKCPAPLKARQQGRAVKCTFIQTEWGYNWGYRSDSDLQLRSKLPLRHIAVQLLAARSPPRLRR